MYWGLGCAATAGLAAGPRRSSTPPRPALRDRGLLDGDGFSDAGRELGKSIEVATDEQMAPALDALGDDVVELFAIMEPWGATVRDGLGYMQSAARTTSPNAEHRSDARGRRPDAT